MRGRKVDYPSRHGVLSVGLRSTHTITGSGKLRQAACTALEQAQSIQLAGVALAPKPEESHAKLRLTTKAGTLEIMDADRSVLEQVLWMMLHAE